MDAASNGIGSDAVLLIYSAKEKKVWSLNAEGTAPKLATIEWYQKNQNGKDPRERHAAFSNCAWGCRCLARHADALGNHEFRSGAGASHRTG